MNESIKTTRNYSQFRFMKGNRAVSSLHLERLITSMREKYVPTPIIVNKDNEIIDGQHRFSATKYLGLPLYYFRALNGSGLEDVRIINTNNRTWTNNDHLKSFMEKERDEYPDTFATKPYHLFDWLKSTYSLPFQIVMSLVGADPFHKAQGFKKGNLKVRDFSQAKADAIYLHAMKEFYEHWRKRSFLSAMCTLMKQSAFNRKRWIRKIGINRTKLVQCTNANDYIERMEYIYNWNERDKVTFKRKING